MTYSTYNLFSDPQESFQRAWLQSSGDGGVVARRAMVTRSPDDQGCDIESAPVPGARPQLLMLTRLGHSSRRTLQNPPSCSPVQWSHQNGFYYDNFPQHFKSLFSVEILLLKGTPLLVSSNILSFHAEVEFNKCHAITLGLTLKIIYTQAELLLFSINFFQRSWSEARGGIATVENKLY